MSFKRFTTTLLAVIALPGAAFAHPGHSDAIGFTLGFMHPLGGLDHMLAMVAAGLYAAQLGRRALWALPLAFVAAMTAGGAFGYVGYAVPMVEQGIALSVIAMGAAIALGLKLPALAAGSLVALFAVFHGVAHGSEGASAASFVPYAAGFVLATMMLHLTGIMLGSAIQSLQTRRTLALSRIAGGIGIAAGAALLMS